MTTVEKIKGIEDEMARTQKNKNTSFHLGQLKAKLAKLRRELISDSSSGGGGGGVGFDVARTGVATIGFPAAYEFTTLTTVPGIIKYKGAKLQMLDLPGIIEGAKDGKGRGKQVIAVARSVNLLFLVLDVNKPLQHKRIIEYELEGVGIRINKEPPNIVITKKERGGINITNTVPLTHLDNDEIKAVMAEYKINSANIAFRCDATVDDLIDAIEAKSRRYIPAIYVLNKIDSFSVEELDLLYKIPNAIPISSGQGWNLDDLLQMMWDKLKLVRVYTKPKVEDFCNSIHKSLVSDFRNALVFGQSVKHQPQVVGLSHDLQDEDVITILKK
ncbi:GTP-binding protein rbg1 [Cerrena zonata]|uniref:GTP-binding protein rbg1 n=1 Tax=Cerrena zonata TaxID=2478898 RepID=A0AAW0FF53_9APHY